jgi:hypothetical protein
MRVAPAIDQVGHFCQPESEVPVPRVDSPKVGEGFQPVHQFGLVHLRDYLTHIPDTHLLNTTTLSAIHRVFIVSGPQSEAEVANSAHGSSKKQLLTAEATHLDVCWLGVGDCLRDNRPPLLVCT